MRAILDSLTTGATHEDPGSRFRLISKERQGRSESGRLEAGNKYLGALATVEDMFPFVFIEVSSAVDKGPDQIRRNVIFPVMMVKGWSRCHASFAEQFAN